MSLVWCEAQCGQNFHLGCMSTWLNTDEHTHNCPNWYVIIIPDQSSLLTYFLVVPIGMGNELFACLYLVSQPKEFVEL